MTPATPSSDFETALVAGGSALVAENPRAEAFVDREAAKKLQAPGFGGVRTPARDYANRMEVNVARMEARKEQAVEIAAAIRRAVDVDDDVAVARELTKQLGGWPDLVTSTDEELDLLGAVLTELSVPGE